MSSDRCRACGGHVSKAFETRILGRYDVAFFRCDMCHSLQSEQPYWLDEAYQSAIAMTDTGAVQRNLMSHAAILAIAKILKVKGRFVDFGGGTGMLCRLLRDSGFDSYVCDRYSDPVYAKGFVLDSDGLIDGDVGLLSAIEVLEHCENPGLDLGKLFALRPGILVATTLPYRGEGEDWWYLSKHTGQHIFFYSEKCLGSLAQKHGYQYFGVGSLHIFSAEIISAWRRIALKILLSPYGLRAARLWAAAFQRGRHADADNVMLSRRLAAQHNEQVGSVSKRVR